MEIGIDTMVLDNNDAVLREGVESTYKKVKGFQPLASILGACILLMRYLETVKHTAIMENHVQRVVSDMVRLIQKGYRYDVPILFLADTGFFDQSLLEYCDCMNVHKTIADISMVLDFSIDIVGGVFKKRSRLISV